MIRVNIVDDERIISSLMEIKNENTCLAWAQEGAQPRGWCAFTAGGELICADARDEYFELVIRAALNKLDLSGVKYAVCKNKTLADRLIPFGFQKCTGGVKIDIPAFFKPCGGCTKN